MTSKNLPESRWPVKDWKFEVYNGDTKLGYAEWLVHKQEDAETEEVDIATQTNEFDMARKFSKAATRMFQTPIVDDDYPEMRQDYEKAVYDLMMAFAANGRQL